ncbi:MAG: hypothetical protein J07HB67_01365 [halophilic archaeon J07HB67]|nr:MAG: hypothetical protein J07HB67_01365 [halophilic archaeon J07HB67]
MKLRPTDTGDVNASELVEYGGLAALLLAALGVALAVGLRFV